MLRHRQLRMSRDRVGRRSNKQTDLREDSVELFAEV
jgi:hypothetical protein